MAPFIKVRDIDHRERIIDVMGIREVRHSASHRSNAIIDLYGESLSVQETVDQVWQLMKTATSAKEGE